MSSFDCIVLLGPTAVGKSSLLYEEFSDQPLFIISADSMQVYEGFDIGTATPNAEELELFPHAGINELSPAENYNVSNFLDTCEHAFVQATAGERLPVVLGGTALYIKSFLFGMDDMPQADPDFRREMRQKAEAGPDNYLHELLLGVDPAAAEKIHPNDRRRLIRALEIFHQTGSTKTELISKNDTIRAAINPLIIGLNRPREELRERIRNRVKTMVAEGLVEEVKKILSSCEPSRTLKQAIGFPEAKNLLEGQINEEEMVEEIAVNTWQFARKQMTWFKRFPLKKWYHPEEDKEELRVRIGKKIEKFTRS